MITIFFTNKEHPWSRGKRWIYLYVLDLFDESQNSGFSSMADKSKVRRKNYCCRESKNYSEIDRYVLRFTSLLVG